MTNTMRPLALSALAACAALAGLALTFTPPQERSTMPLAIAPAHAEIAAPYRPWLPPGYVETSRRGVSVDGEPAFLVRHARADGRNAFVGGEHVSAVVAADGRLKGLARIERALVGGTLPTREEAHAVAMDFLARAAPDLRAAHRVSWIEPHDEPLRVAQDGGTDLTVTGMKVKMRSTADGLWFWVIVGADREVMVFERDIVWLTFPGRRQTEKWLHDTWLVENGYAPAAT